MRIDSVAFVVGLLLAFPLSPSPVLAGWSPDGITITPTTAKIPLVEACADNAHGAFVVWQEESSPGNGVLRAKHVLANGDLDPTWPGTGASVCDVVTARSIAGVLPDRLGGVYAWWVETTQLYVTRLDATGQVATGWPARGRSLGEVFSYKPFPRVIEDGANGFYVAFVASVPPGINSLRVAVVHLGPSNTGAGGAPNGVQFVSPLEPVLTMKLWPQIALAPDGGAFVAWASSSFDTTVVQSTWRVRRIEPSGANTPGWPAAGIDFGPFRFDNEFFPFNISSGLLGLSPDDRGGCFVLIGNPMTLGQNPYVDDRLYRLQGDGQSAGDWPAAGLALTEFWNRYADIGVDGSYLVMSDGLDGSFYGLQRLYADAPPALQLLGRNSLGQATLGFGTGGVVPGARMVPTGDGACFIAQFVPDGPTSTFSPDAFINVSQVNGPSSWSGFGESHHQPGNWYGDIGLASTEDRGVIFVWSQSRQRIGLFARRFSSAGEITDVGAQPGVLSMRHLRFAAGVGVRVSLSIPAGASARLELFDVSGRRLATERLAGSGGAVEVTLPATAALRSGIYFVKLTARDEMMRGRMVVAR